LPILPETGSDPIEFVIPESVFEPMDPGIHSLSIRWADDEGVWGIPATILIYLTGHNTQSGSDLWEPPAAGEYFFDQDPGYGNGFVVPELPTSVAEAVTFEIPALLTSELTPGIHSLSLRWADADGRWGFPFTQFIYIADDG